MTGRDYRAKLGASFYFNSVLSSAPQLPERKLRHLTSLPMIKSFCKFFKRYEMSFSNWLILTFRRVSRTWRVRRTTISDKLGRRKLLLVPILQSRNQQKSRSCKTTSRQWAESKLLALIFEKKF